MAEVWKQDFSLNPLEEIMRYLLSLALVALLAAPALAAFEGPGSNAAAGSTSAAGFQGPTSGVQATTVEKAQQCSDDAPVVLTGNIISREAGSKDKYMFRDATGEILVDIDNKVFAGRQVTPQNTVRLTGKVDKDMLKPVKVDVKVLEILK